MDSAVDNALVQWSIAHGQAGANPPVESASTEQQEWDKPSIAADVARLNSSLPGRHWQACLLAVSAPHSGDWLHALPISSCGLRQDDEAVRVEVGLHCEPISVHAAPWSVLKALTASHADAMPAEQLDITL